MTAREAWDTLALLYPLTSLGNIFRLSIEFNTLKHKPKKSAINFINSVTAAATKLQFLGKDLSDQKIKWQLLGNLNLDYNSLVTTLTNIDNEDHPMNIPVIREAILRKERMIMLHRSKPASVQHHQRTEVADAAKTPDPQVKKSKD